MTICRFENRITGCGLHLHDQVERIAVHCKADLPAAWRNIERARQSGYWVALLLDYELGAWLEPSFGKSEDNDCHEPFPRLTALVFTRAESRQFAPDTTASRHVCLNESGPVSASKGSSNIQLSPSLQPQPSISRNEYTQSIETIRAGIARGDYYQVNYTQPLRCVWPSELSPENVYDTLAARHPVAYAACIQDQDEDRWILSLSPELFVKRRGTRLSTRPMKGTAPRHADPKQDRQSAQALLSSAKNRAENLMIVDLLRNDLGKIATPGSVCVPKLFNLEAYPSVWTLTSTVEAEAPDEPLSAVLRALFPCGSVTGAPKHAAMQAISALENRRRGIYCGSVGWLAPNGDFSLNVAIRTIELRSGQAEFGVGGGIVHDSRASEEWEECLWKARVLNLD